MRRTIFLSSCVVIAILLMTDWAYSATFVVDSLGDMDDGNPYTPADGTNTLRKCIRLANSPGGDTINFAISGEISPDSALPHIFSDGTIIDASSRWNGVWPSGQPGIDLNGVSVRLDGLVITAAKDCHIRGMRIRNFTKGVLICAGAQFNTIGGAGVGARNVICGGNIVGVEIKEWATGNVVSGNHIIYNQVHGVIISGGAQSNTIGGTTEGERNIISDNGTSANGIGVHITGTSTDNNVVLGNYIGTDVTGTADLGNAYSGVEIADGAQSNTIGGTTEGERNIISGSSSYDPDIEFDYASGIRIIGAGTDKNVVSGNYIGTDVTGTADLGNEYSGVEIADGAQSNTIGGTTPGERNVISGNDGHGVDLRSSGNIVSGNYIGTNASGAADLGNSWIGVLITGGSNTIGGTTPGERNVISGNNNGGMFLSSTDNNVVSGNYIGTDATGTADLGNALYGVKIAGGAQSNTIGGTTPGERNIISGNDGHGVAILGILFSHSNNVSGNYIGTDVAGAADLGNLDDGIFMDEAQSNTVSGNAVAFNGANGVRVHGTDTDYNKISRNSIHDNASLGIDLVDGGNDEIPAPTITSGELAGNILSVSGTGAGAFGLVEIFEADSAAIGEGMTYLGSLTADGRGSFFGPLDVTGKGISVRDPVVATTTHTDDNTSEFSTPIDVTGSGPVSIELSLCQGWNMISFPGDPVDPDVADIVAGTPVLPFFYTYDVNGYVPVTTVEYGPAYWVASPVAYVLTVSYEPHYILEWLDLNGNGILDPGEPRRIIMDRVDVPMGTGWSMVGSADCVVSIDSLSSSPPNHLPFAYTYDCKSGSYVPVTELIRGVGHWAAATAPCTLTIDCAAPPSSAVQNILNVTEPVWESTLTVQSQGQQAELIFGVHPSATAGIDMPVDKPLPPPAPAMSADNGKGKGKDKETILNAGWSTGNDSFPLLSASYVGSNDPLVWQLSVELSKPGKVKVSGLPDDFDCILVEDVKSRSVRKGSVSLHTGEHELTLVLDELPVKNKVLANYPNPFNPETWIPFHLSQEADVSVRIYDSVGRLVSSLALGHRSEGIYVDKSKAAYWDGKNEAGEPVSSGVYFYTIQAGEFTATKKMIVAR